MTPPGTFTSKLSTNNEQEAFIPSDAPDFSKAIRRTTELKNHPSVYKVEQSLRMASDPLGETTMFQRRKEIPAKKPGLNLIDS